MGVEWASPIAVPEQHESAPVPGREEPLAVGAATGRHVMARCARGVIMAACGRHFGFLLTFW
jgi:hypothetical protein